SLGGHRMLTDELPVRAHHTAEVLRPGAVVAAVDHDVPDLFRPQFLRKGWRLIVSFGESGAKAGRLAGSYTIMAHELHTRITALLPPACAVRLTKVTIEKTSVGLQLTATAPTAACPCCAVSSSSIHSRYQRHLTDLPWGTCMVRIQLRVRKF